MPIENKTLRALEGDDRYAVIRYDGDFRVTGWSHGASLLFGWTVEEALGRTAAELIKLPASALEQAKVDDLRHRLRQTGDVRHSDTWNAKHRRAVMIDAYTFASDDGFVSVVTGRQLDTGNRRKMRQINLRLPDELIAAIEGLRGDIPRERFLRMVITAYVEAARRDETPS